MSGQAKRSRIRHQERVRRGLAMHVAALEISHSIVCGMCVGLGFTDDDCMCPRSVRTVNGHDVHFHHADADCSAKCRLCEGTGEGRRALALALLASRAQGFDVARARAYARELLALADEQAAFEDHTRGLGLGPENRDPGAFAPSAEDVARRIAAGRTRGLSKLAPFHRRGGWPGKLARKWGGDPRAANGRALARVGQRLLDALEGQPDECRAGCFGSGWRKPHTDARNLAPCPDCAGTGHNMRGYLPPVEVTPQLRRKGWEATRGAGANDGRESTPLMRDLYEAGREHGWAYLAPHRDNSGGDEWTVETRACPRGEHRNSGPEARRILDWAPGWSPDPGDQSYPWRCAPSWKRGELTHAHRREKARTARAHARVRAGLVEPTAPG